MKKLFIALLGLAMAAEVSAQTVISEEFDGSTRLDWQEYADKTCSALPKNGYFELKAMAKETAATTRTMLPIDIEDNFVVRCSILLPRMDKENTFGIFFDMDDNFNKTLMLFSVHRVACLLFNNDKVQSAGDTQRIKFEGGRNCRADLELRREGNKITVTLNNMEVYDLRRNTMHTPLFGFYTDTEMHIESFSVEQDGRGE